MPRTQSADWSVDDDISAVHLQEMNEDMDDLYSQGSDRLRVVRAASGIAAKIDIGAGAFRVADTHGTYAGGTDIAVTLSQTNYVQIDASGTIQINTSAWNAAYARLAIVVCNGSGITSITLWKTDAVGGLLAGSVTVNTQTLAATFTMTTADKKYQYLDPDGASRTVTLPSSGASEGDSFFIKNTGDDQYVLNVQTGGSTIKMLRSGESCMFVYNGSAWKTMLGDLPDITMFGDGRDGAGLWTAGTTNLDNTKVWNWDSFTLGASGTISVTTVNVPLVGRVRGDMSIAGTISLSGKGAAGAPTYADLAASGASGTNGGLWQASPFNLATGPTGGGGGPRDGTGNNNVDGKSGGGGASMFTDGSAGTSSGGTAGAKMTAANIGYMLGLGFYVACGAGGGSGGSPGGSGPSGSAGAGGNGGGSAIFFVYGNLTIETTAVINVSGTNATAGSGNPGGWNDGYGGGGGGGGGTIIFVVYGTVTINGTPTYTVTAGTGANSEDADNTGGAGGIGKILHYNPITGVATVLA